MSGDAIHPAIVGLLQLLPRRDESWSEAQLEAFMDALRATVRLVYPPATPVDVIEARGENVRVLDTGGEDGR